MNDFVVFLQKIDKKGRNMQQRRALGKGLSSLIPSKKTEDMMPAVHASTALSENTAKSEGLAKLKLENIAPNRQQPRKELPWKTTPSSIHNV